MDRSRSPTPASSLRSASNSSHSGSSRSPTGATHAHAPYRSERYGQRRHSPPSAAVLSAAPFAYAMRNSGDDRRGGASDPEAPHDAMERARERARRSDDEDDEHSLAPDDEGEAGSSTQPDASSAVLESRKKRTRTLTTPYQSAVLHDLLAQSRFPTTQVREEVGRTIGLSARKVQIWFQNQRQKAKRNAQNQTATTTAPASAPPAVPQYGPYTYVSGSHALVASGEASSAVSFEPTFGVPGGQMHASRGTFPSDPSGFSVGRQPTHRSQPPAVEPYARPQSSGSQLAGPGIPGQSLPSLPEDAFLQPSGLPAFADPYYDTTASLSSHSLSRHSTASSHSSWRRRRGSSIAGTHDYHTGLPPLLINERTGSSSAPSTGLRPLSASTPLGSGMVLSAPPSAMSFDFAHLPPADAPFAHRLPDLPPQGLPPHGPGASAHLGLPPPFTLEPAPRWDPAWYHPFSRPSSASTPRAPFELAHADDGASFGRRASYSPVRERPAWDPREPGIIPRPRRAGRYDPVRASMGMPGPSQPYLRHAPEEAMDLNSEDDADDEGPPPSRSTPRRHPH